jgi:ketosteroid isomerase-like protein
MSIEPDHFTPAGDHVLVSTHQPFRSKTGVEVERDVTQLLRFRDGKVTYAAGYRDRSNALKALGLSG